MFPSAVLLALALASTLLGVDASPLGIRQDDPANDIPNAVCDWTLRTPNDSNLLDQNLVAEMNAAGTLGYRGVLPETVEIKRIATGDIVKYEGDGIWGATVLVRLYNTTAGEDLLPEEAADFSRAIVQVPVIATSQVNWDVEVVSCRNLKTGLNSFGAEKSIVYEVGDAKAGSKPSLQQRHDVEKRDIYDLEPICTFNITPDDKSSYSGISLTRANLNAVTDAVYYTFENSTTPVLGVGTFTPTRISINRNESLTFTSQVYVIGDDFSPWSPEDSLAGFESVRATKYEGWAINTVECALPN